ncbi:hypothetical protein [Kosakonia phage Kc304]|nr:hypothetical protein [Kosakonia phage Kc304]UJJ22103.1 hypothetical protein [Erwinia phage Virsaitis27]UYM28765.1 hypothetical protein [Serratia phage vB_SspM_LC53]
MSEEQKDRLNELIGDLVVANRDQVDEYSRWDSSRSARQQTDNDIIAAESALETFIEGL